MTPLAAENLAGKEDAMDTMVLTLALNIIRAIVKNPAKKKALRTVLLNLRDAIDAAFASPES